MGGVNNNTVQTDIERSTIPLEMILCVGAAVFDESLKYGDFQKGKLFQGLQDFLNKSRMGSNHFDRDALSHDVYYAALYLAEVSLNFFNSENNFYFVGGHIHTS